MEFAIAELDAFTVVTATITAPEGVLNPSDLATINPPGCPEDIPGHKGIVINGRLPLWVAAHLTHHYHACAWLAINSPRDGGAVVVSRHRPDAPPIGSVVSLPKD